MIAIFLSKYFEISTHILGLNPESSVRILNSVSDSVSYTQTFLTNGYLNDFDFFANFNLDENFNEVIKSRHRDEFSYDSFSEGEKQRIDLAILFTWREVARMKNSVNTNLLILDEVFDSSLDSEGTENFMKVMNSLEGRGLNVFVISHKTDLLADKFDKQIKFEKIGNFSHKK